MAKRNLARYEFKFSYGRAQRGIVFRHNQDIAFIYMTITTQVFQ